MKRILGGFLCLGLNAALFAQTYFPPKTGDTWETIDPASLGYCQTNIDDLYTYLEQSETKSFILLKDGKIVLERYFDDGNVDKTWPWYSAGKCLTATLVGIAQEEGLLNITDTSSTYLGQGWSSLTPQQEEKITIWHQLTMTSGLDETTFSCTDPGCLTYVADAGDRWVYHNSPYNLLRVVIDSASGDEDFNYNTFTNQKLANKIGMKLSAFWVKVGYSSFFFSRARDMARFGWLIANDGVWDGTTVLGDVDYINAMRTPSQSLNPSYGYLWWLNGQSSFILPDDPASYPGSIGPNSPADAYTAAGSQGQFISISPSTSLMIIRQGVSSDESKAPINLLDNIWNRVLQLDCPITGTEDDAAESITLFPNPVIEGQMLNISMDGSFEYTITDNTGTLVAEGIASRQFDVKKLKKGVYFLTLKNEKLNKTLTFFKH